MISRKSILAVACCGVLALGVAACGSSSSSSTSGGSSAANTPLTGAGSTLIAPLMSKWQSDYSSRTGNTVTYGAIGSGGGIEQITAGTVDFGASDAPLTPDQQKAAADVLMIPWALSSTDPVYNINGVSDGLRLDGPTLANIFLGNITAWNDPAIAKLNPGVTLPSTKITPVYRSDGSGDTYILTDYLSKVSSEWKSKVGVGTEVKFPTGVGGKGNDGVSAVLSKTDGAIAYVGAAYAASNGFNQVAVRERRRQVPAAHARHDQRRGRRRQDDSVQQRRFVDGSAEVGDKRVSAGELHVRARAVHLGQGGFAEGVHHLRDRTGPVVRA